uniref:hypothetical protein n=1 Tax=Pleomorphomonas koreensis TaxID=257440 RepID=UPI001AEBE93C
IFRGIERLMLPKLPKTRKEALEEVRQYRLDHPRPVSPCIDQTEADVAAYYKAASAGAAAIVRETQGDCLRYTVTEVEGTAPRLGRVYIKNFGAFYAKTGKNCFHPKGQTRLVVPTEAISAWIAEHPLGEFGVQYWKSQNGAIL